MGSLEMAKRSAPSPMASENDWRAEDDLRTLIAAEKIKHDPKRMKACMAKKREMSKHLAKAGS